MTPTEEIIEQETPLGAIKDARRRKQQMELEIAKLIVGFETATLLKIENIKVLRTEAVNAIGQKRIRIMTEARVIL